MPTAYVSWDLAPGADDYAIFIWDDPSTMQHVGNVQAASFEVPSYGTYFFGVQSFAAGQPGAVSQQLGPYTISPGWRRQPLRAIFVSLAMLLSMWVPGWAATYDLGWNAPSGWAPTAVNICVERKPEGGSYSPLTCAVSPIATTYEDTTASGSVRYRIRALLSGGGFSVYSNEACRPTDCSPSAPTGLHITGQLAPPQILLVASTSGSTYWAGILDPARAFDWTQAGAGTIPTTWVNCATAACNTVYAGTVTAASVNAAISGAPDSTVVRIPAGTFTISGGGFELNNRNNVILRGAGPNSTFLTFTGSANCTLGASICVQGGLPAGWYESMTVANWTAGLSQGSTSITVSTKTNLQIGTRIVLDQVWDNEDADTGTVYVCTTSPPGAGQPGCTQAAAGSVMGRTSDRAQFQVVTVTSVPAVACAPTCVIGITPAIYMPNWRTAKTAQAWWVNGLPSHSLGVEEMSLNLQGTAATTCIQFAHTHNSWVKHVRCTRPINYMVKVFVADHITVRDSYFFTTANHQNDSYGVDSYYSSDLLVENNIFQWITTPMPNEGCTGCVYAYNFSINDEFGDGTWMMGSSMTHFQYNCCILWESNDGVGLTYENYFGTPFFNTAFRNRWSGWEPQPAVLVNQTVPVHNYARARFHNYIGNVLGTNAYHTNYEVYPISQTHCNNELDGQCVSACVLSIFALGLGDNCGNGTNTGQSPYNDMNTRPNTMRWGNCDTVNGTNNCRFVSAEVPSGATFFPNAVPASQTLPASFYLSAKPSFFGSVPWPAIGPDVTGGDVTGSGQSVNAGLNGRVYRIPARKCYEDVMGGTFANSTTIKTFNPAACGY